MSKADTLSQLFNHITAISHGGNISFLNWEMMNFKSNTAVLVNKIRDSTPTRIIFRGTCTLCKSNACVTGRRQQACVFNSSDRHEMSGNQPKNFHTDDAISFSKIHHVELVNHHSFEIFRASVTSISKHYKTTSVELHHKDKMFRKDFWHL